MLVGNTLRESPGMKFLVKLRVIDLSADTASSYRPFTMPFLRYLDERAYLFNEPLDRLGNNSFSIRSIFDYVPTDMIWIIRVVELSAERAIGSPATAPIENRNTRSDSVHTVGYETFADSQLRIGRNSNLHAFCVRVRGSEYIVRFQSLLNTWRMT